MAALRDRRHEQVAQLLAVMKTPAAASREAGYKDGTSFDANARKRANRRDIRARVAELQAAQADLVEIDAAWIRRKVARIAGIEFDASEVEPGQALAALNLLAKMTHGALVPTKVEASGPNGGPIETDDKTKRDDLDVARRMAFLLAQAAQRAGGKENP
jgi:hypothetical protein